MSDNKEKPPEKPWYAHPYRGKPRLFLDSLLRDSEDESTTLTNHQIMDRNAHLLDFLTEPFCPASQYLQSPSSTSSLLLSPLTCPSSTSSTPNIMPSTDLEIAKQKVLKQCQYFICYVIYELIFSQKTMQKKTLKRTMYENYHGDENRPHILHHAWLFTQGKGKFGAVMEQSPVDGRKRLTNDATQEDHNFTISEIPLAGMDVGKVITLSLLKKKSINSDVLFSEASVFSYAMDSVKLCKQAVAAGKAFLQPDGSLPSGCNKQDYYNKVLDIMYEKVKGEPDVKKALDGTTRVAILERERPPNWVFNGWMAFVAFGPMAEDSALKSNLMTGGKFIVYDSILQYRRLTNKPMFLLSCCF